MKVYIDGEDVEVHMALTSMLGQPARLVSNDELATAFGWWRVRYETPDGNSVQQTAPRAGWKPTTAWIDRLIASLAADFGGVWMDDWDVANRVVTVRVIDTPE